MNVLYVLRRPDDPTALSALRRALERKAEGAGEGAVASSQASLPGLLLLQDAVYLDSAPGKDVRVFYARGDAEARGTDPPGQALDWEEIVDLLFSFDRVLGW